MPLYRRESTEKNAHDEIEEKSETRELKSIGDGFDEYVLDRTEGTKGNAKIAAQNGPQPFEILDHNRPIESIVLADAFDCLGADLRIGIEGQRITGSQVKKKKRNRAQPPDQGHRPQNPPDTIAPHKRGKANSLLLFETEIAGYCFRSCSGTHHFSN
jgi:hypothetical protein